MQDRLADCRPSPTTPTMASQHYGQQHRGSTDASSSHFASMDKSLHQKVALTTAHFPTSGCVADMGSGSGRGTFDLACLHPELDLVGVDINPAAVASARLQREVPGDERKHLARVLDGSAMRLPRERVPSDVYVVSTLEAALWRLANHHDFEQQVLAAVNLGGDTDTTGAVVGGMAGWVFGAQAIPASWLAALPRQTEILDLADRFAGRCLTHWSSHGPG